MDPELYSRKAAPKDSGEPSLWDQPAPKTEGQRKRTPSPRNPEIAKKVVKAAEIFEGMLLRAKREGLAVGWAKDAFRRAGVITGGEHDRDLSWFGLVPAKAHAVPSGRFTWVNGNRSTIWVHESFADPARRSA